VYSIQEADRLKTKRIAGRIMPAIATTTSAVSGLVALELIKLLGKERKISSFRNAFLNLALPLFTQSEPAPVEKIKITGDLYYTLWDRWDIHGDLILQDFNKHFQEKYKLTVTGIFQDCNMIYVPLLPHHRKRLTEKLSGLLTKMPDKDYVDLTVSYEDDDGQDVTGPAVRYHFGAQTSTPKKSTKKKQKKDH